MFKGFTSSDSEFKKEVEDAIRAMKNSKTDDMQLPEEESKFSYEYLIT